MILGHEGMALPPIESDYASLSPNHLEQAEFNIEQMIIGTTEHEANIFAKRAFETSENLRDVISGVGHMVSLVGILRSVFHTPIVESRRIVAAYFDEEREYSENELTELIAEAATDLFFACPAKFYAEVSGLMPILGLLETLIFLTISSAFAGCHFDWSRCLPLPLSSSTVIQPL